MTAATQCTGPLTPQGKFNSSRNAITHGLTAQNIERLPESIREDFRAFFTQLVDEWQPQSLNEELYLSQYAFAQFQLLRGRSLEINAREAFLANPNDEAAEKTLAKFTRHTRALERSAKDALKELRIFIENRLASIEANEALAEIAGPGIQFPIAFPHHMLVEKKALRKPVADNALRFALSQNTCHKSNAPSVV